jgi:membrane-associated phospholipid phosphatase
LKGGHTRRLAGLGVSLALSLGAGAARADGPTSGGGVRYDTPVDVAVTLGAGALWIGSESLEKYLAPASCRWCDRTADGKDALDGLDASVRSALLWNDTGSADTASNLTGFVGTPAVALGAGALAAAHDNRSHEAPANTLLVLEAAALASDLNQTVKLIAGRQRPFVHFRPPGATVPHDPDDDLSFYSGHTSLTFSLAVASGTIASIRGYRAAPAVWASSLAFATTTGYLRIAADKHYFTDVLTGAVLGSAVGFAIPFLFHRAADSGSGAAAAQQAMTGSGPMSVTGPLGGGPWIGGAFRF